MATIIEPPLAVLSGPLSRRSDCRRALEAAGFTILDPDPLPDDFTNRPAHRGLPAHRNPQDALKAGASNAGHTPGTSHPESDAPYEDDPRVGWLDVQIPNIDIALDEVHRIAQDARFTLRAHYSEHAVTVPDLTVEQRLEIIEEHLAAIRPTGGGASR